MMTKIKLRSITLPFSNIPIKPELEGTIILAGQRHLQGTLLIYPRIQNTKACDPARNACLQQQGF